MKNVSAPWARQTPLVPGLVDPGLGAPRLVGVGDLRQCEELAGKVGTLRGVVSANRAARAPALPRRRAGDHVAADLGVAARREERDHLGVRVVVHTSSPVSPIARASAEASRSAPRRTRGRIPPPTSGSLEARDRDRGHAPTLTDPRTGRSSAWSITPGSLPVTRRSPSSGSSGSWVLADGEGTSKALARGRAARRDRPWRSAFVYSGLSIAIPIVISMRSTASSRPRTATDPLRPTWSSSSCSAPSAPPSPSPGAMQQRAPASASNAPRAPDQAYLRYPVRSTTSTRPDRSSRARRTTSTRSGTSSAGA